MVNKKKLTFMILVRDSGWWTLGEITRQALAHDGFDVELSWAKREERLDLIGNGKADFGVNAGYEVAWAYRGIGIYEGQPITNLRAIASIGHPNWHAVAVTYETRITAIEQIKERQFPLRIYTPHAAFGGRIGSGGFITDRIFEAYGFTLKDIERWGGKVITGEGGGGRALRECNFDAMTYRAYAGFGPGGHRWQEATMFNNLRFLPVAPHLLSELCQKYGLRQGLMPRLLMRGVEENIPTLYFPNFVIYSSIHLDEELAFLTAKSLDEHNEYFAERYVPFLYNPFRVCQDTGAPLHPGAERYYRSRGYLT
jgi:TRAP-type uncharacterized transport system substrate-binding protein